MRPASWLLQARPAALVVDYAGEATVKGEAIITDEAVAICSLREAQQWAGDLAHEAASVPALARALREAGARAVCVVGVPEGRGEGSRTLHWLDTEHARGWLAPAGEM